MSAIRNADGMKRMTEAEKDAASGGPNRPLVIDTYLPSYRRGCCICNARPVVKGILNGKIAYDGDMCGPCTWGDADAADPADWNRP